MDPLHHQTAADLAGPQGWAVFAAPRRINIVYVGFAGNPLNFTDTTFSKSRGDTA